MKAILFLFLFAGTAQAATVKDARVDFEKNLIEVDVFYAGGCFDHDFELKVDRCTKRIPAACSAILTDVSTEIDVCDALAPQTVKFSFKELGIFPGKQGTESLTILGDGESSATVNLIEEVKVDVVAQTSFIGSFQDSDGRFVRLGMRIMQNGEMVLTKRNETLFSGKPSLVQDSRPADGNLVLQLGPASLSVGSGFTPSGLISYTLKLNGQNVVLSPNVFLNITK